MSPSIGSINNNTSALVVNTAQASKQVAEGTIGSRKVIAVANHGATKLFNEVVEPEAYQNRCMVTDKKLNFTFKQPSETMVGQLIGQIAASRVR